MPAPLNKGKRLYGDLFIAKLDTDLNPIEFSDPVNGITLVLSPGTFTSNPRISRLLESEGQNLSNWTGATAGPSLTLTTDEQNAKVVAHLLNGTYEQLDIAESAVSGEEHVVTTFDAWHRLDNDHLTAAAVTAADESGTPTYTEDTHFVIHRPAGMYKWLSGVAGIPVVDDVIDWGYTRGAHVIDRIKGSTGVPGKFALLLVGKNSATGKAARLYVPIWSAAPNGDTDLYQSPYIVAGLSGAIETPADGSEPYQLDDDV